MRAEAENTLQTSKATLLLNLIESLENKDVQTEVVDPKDLPATAGNEERGGQHKAMKEDLRVNQEKKEIQEATKTQFTIRDEEMD